MRIKPQLLYHLSILRACHAKDILQKERTDQTITMRSLNMAELRVRLEMSLDHYFVSSPCCHLFKNEIDYLFDSFAVNFHDTVVIFGYNIKETAFSQCDDIIAGKASSFSDNDYVRLYNDIIIKIRFAIVDFVY